MGNNNKNSAAGICFPVIINRLLRLLILISFSIFSFISSSTASAQNDSSLEGERILVLHGVWASQFWEWEFDTRFHELLELYEESEVHLSSTYLGVANNLSRESTARLAANVEATIAEQGVDLVVAVLPPAIQFLEQLNLSPELPVVLVVPDESNMPQLNSRSLAIVPSAGNLAMERTLEQILVLLPEIATLEVMVGNGPGDLSYLERFQTIAGNFETQLDFNYSVGIPRGVLIDQVGSLPQSSAILLLPAESSGEDFAPEISESMQDLTDASSVPVFGIYDSPLRYGIAGGHLTSVRDYAAQAVEHSLGLLRGESVDSGQGRASTIYNWDRVQHWNLPIERLGADVELVGQPSNLFEDYPFLSTLTLNIIAALTVGLGLMAYMYRRSQQARALIAASGQKIRESEERYRLVTDNVADIIWVWEEESTSLKFCNSAIERVTGFTVAEFLEMTIEEMMTEEDFKAIARAFSEPVVPMITRQIQLRHKNGGFVWAEMAVQVARTLENGKREWVGVSRDITQRKQNEIERNHLEEQIKQAQKIESLGTLAGGIAHDFNNILTVIIGITEMLKLESDDRPSSQKLLNRLHKAADKARLLVQQILTFSRQSKGEKSVFKLNDLVAKNLELLTAGKPDAVQLRIDVADDLLLNAKSGQIEQLIVNLVSNAIEAVPGKSGVIELTAQARAVASDATLTHGQLSPGDYISLRVEDNGAGMDAEALSKAFDPFYTSKELGSGMGLAIVHGIVLDHGGAIDVQSEPNRGTSIEVLLPASEERNSTSPAAIKDSQNTGAKRIIVVDDQEELLLVVAEMLEQLGHHCITCADPKEALQVIREQSKELDLIITDYSMPDMNGIELMEQCQAHCPDIPVIISTGYGDHETSLSAQMPGLFALLNKPYDLAKLREVVDGAA